MNFDYDRLRVTVQNLDAPDHKLARIAQWAVGDQAEDLARELLRLRRELTDLRNLMRTHSEYLRKNGHDTAANWVHTHEYKLTRIIKGDTE